MAGSTIRIGTELEFNLLLSLLSLVLMLVLMVTEVRRDAAIASAFMLTIRGDHCPA